MANLLPIPRLLALCLLWAVSAGCATKPAAPPPGPTPATWAQPESEAERRLVEEAGTPGGRSRLGDHYLASGRPFSAAWQYSEAIGEADTTATARARTTLSLAHALRAGRWYGVAEHVLASTGALTASEDARRLRAEMRLETGRASEALAGKPLPPDPVLLGRLRQAAGDLKGARSAYEFGAKRSDATPEAAYRLGLLLLTMNEPERAVSFLRQASVTAPKEPRFAVALGRALLALGDRASTEEAGRRFLAATEASPDNVPAHLHLGRFHQGQRRAREAGREFLTVLRLDPRNADAHRHLAELMTTIGEPGRAHLHRGWSYVFADQPQRAAEEFRGLAAVEPQNVEAPLLISQAYMEMVQNTRAAEEVAAALKRMPHNPSLLGRLAGLQFITHNRRAAAALCEEWRRRQPDAVEPIWLQGKLAYAGNRLDEGVRLLTEATTRDPGRAEYAFDLAEVLARRPSRENLNRALASLARAITLSPGTVRYRYKLGVVLLRLGELEGARRQLLRVLDQDPRHTQAVNSLVQVAQSLQRPRQAEFWAAAVPELATQVREETDLRRRVGQEPRDATARVALARLLARRGDLAKARAHLGEALRTTPGAPGARDLLARVERTIAVMEP
jgi:tetratricopeptide (TPR) repeat protein